MSPAMQTSREHPNQPAWYRLQLQFVCCASRGADAGFSAHSHRQAAVLAWLIQSSSACMAYSTCPRLLLCLLTKLAKHSSSSGNWTRVSHTETTFLLQVSMLVRAGSGMHFLSRRGVEVQPQLLFLPTRQLQARKEWLQGFAVLRGYSLPP